MVEKVHILGLRETQQALRKLPDSTAKNILRRILRRRGQPIADKAKSLVRTDEQDLKKSIAVSPKLSKNQKRKHRKQHPDDVEMFVGAGPHPSAIWNEFGTGERHQSSGKSVGRITPQPFMRPAWDAKKRGVLDGIRSDLWSEIKKSAARLARKAQRAANRGK